MNGSYFNSNGGFMIFRKQFLVVSLLLTGATFGMNAMQPVVAPREKVVQFFRKHNRPVRFVAAVAGVYVGGHVLNQGVGQLFRWHLPEAVIELVVGGIIGLVSVKHIMMEVKRLLIPGAEPAPH
jgi:hypothetical protein